jgi:hypothetical protein
MAAPGAAVGAPVIQTQSLIPLVERVGNQLELRKQREQARQDKINKEWTDLLSEMDYNGLDTVQNQTISQQNDQIMQGYTSALKKGGGQMNYTDRLGFLQQQNRIKASADRMRAANDNVKMVNQEMKDKGYFKDQLMMQDVYNNLHTYDEATGRWVGRDDVNPEEIVKMLSNAKYIDGDAYFKKDLEDFEKITAVGQRQGPLNSTLITDIETRDVWMRNENGTIKRNGDGEPVPNMEMLMEELSKDPDKRKIYQSLAQQADQSLGEYLYDRVMANTGMKETYRTNIRPYKPATDRYGRSQELQDRRNRQAINKLSDMFNQHEDVLANAEESDIPTESGGLYDDVTKQFPWLLEKGKKPHKVLIDRMQPDTIFIVDEEGKEPRAVSRQELPNLVNSIETMNTNYKGLTDIGIEDEFFDIEGTLGQQTGRAPDEERQQQLQEQALTLQQHRNRLRTKYKDIGQDLRGTLPTFLGAKVGEQFRKLTPEEATRLEGELNNDFNKAKIVFNNLEAAKDMGLPTRSVSNLEFKITPGQKQRIKIIANGVDLGEMPPEDFEAIMEGRHPEYKIVIGQEAMPKEPQRGMFDPEE